MQTRTARLGRQVDDFEAQSTVTLWMQAAAVDCCAGGPGGVGLTRPSRSCRRRLSCCWTTVRNAASSRAGRRRANYNDDNDTSTVKDRGRVDRQTVSLPALQDCHGCRCAVRECTDTPPPGFDPKKFPLPNKGIIVCKISHFYIKLREHTYRICGNSGRLWRPIVRIYRRWLHCSRAWTCLPR